MVGRRFVFFLGMMHDFSGANCHSRVCNQKSPEISVIYTSPIDPKEMVFVFSLVNFCAENLSGLWSSILRQRGPPAEVRYDWTPKIYPKHVVRRFFGCPRNGFSERPSNLWILWSLDLQGILVPKIYQTHLVRRYKYKFGRLGDVRKVCFHFFWGAS